MATLKLTYRTSKKDAEFAILRVRYNIDAKKALYGVTETTIRIKSWNLKKEELDLKYLTSKDTKGLSFEERNELVEETDKDCHVCC